MSVCMCKIVDPDQWDQLFKKFFSIIVPDNIVGHSDWCLLSLKDMAEAGNDVEQIFSAIPFRKKPCTRTNKCCGMCTRQCDNRCLQDCMHRMYLWSKSVNDSTPLSIRLALEQKFESIEYLSLVVGEIISQKTNSKLKEYMNNENLRASENPNKINYEPSIEIDPNTGKRYVDPSSGRIKIREWPKSGLCPFCLPGNMLDRRFKGGRAF